MADKISNARKKELEQPDPFLESLYKGVALAQSYRKQLIWAACAVAAVLIIVSGTVYSIKSSETKAAALLSQALETHDTMTPGEGYKAVVKDMERLLESYPNTDAGKMGRLRFAEMAYEAGEFDKALALYEAALSIFDKDPIMANLIHVALGHTCRMLDKDDRAATFFQAVVRGNSDYLKDEALFNLGLLAQKKGESDKEKQYFDQIVSDYSQSIYGAIARAKGGENNS